MNYTNYEAKADKLIKKDGSITTFSGEIIVPADDKKAEIYTQMEATADKFIIADGSIKTLSELIGSGGSVDLSSYAKIEYVDNKISEIDLTGYATIEQVNANKTTQDEINTTVNNTLNNLAESQHNIPSISLADLSSGLTNNTIKAGDIYFITDGTNNYTGETGTYIIIKSDGTPDSFVLESELEAHRQTDLARWQEVANLKTMVLDLQAGIANKKLNSTQTIDIETQAQGRGYTVDNALGGRVNFSATSVLVSAGTLLVNGIEVWSSAGLSLSIGPIKDSIDAQDGDNVTCTGMETITFTPYIAN